VCIDPSKTTTVEASSLYEVKHLMVFCNQNARQFLEKAKDLTTILQVAAGQLP
jgi:hypothetical protein